MSSSDASVCDRRRSKIGCSGHVPRSISAPRPGRERTRDVLDGAPAGDVGGRVHAGPRARARAPSGRRSPHGSSSSSASGRSRSPGRRIERRSRPSSDVAHQRVAVRVQAARGEPDAARRPRAPASGPSRSVLVDHARRRTRRGRTGRRASRRGARPSRRPAARTRPAGIPRPPPRRSRRRARARRAPPRGSRGRTAARRPCTRRRRRTSRPGRCPRCRAARPPARSRAWCRRRRWPRRGAAVADPEEAREPADARRRPRGGGARAASSPISVDGLRGRLDVDPGPAVGVAHDGRQPQLVLEHELARLLGDRDRVLAVEARAAERPCGATGGRDHPFEREVAERIGADVRADLLDGEVGRDQLLPRRHVDAVEARPLDRRARDADVDLGGARPRGGPATICFVVVPRTIESSTTTRRLPRIESGIGFSFSFTPRSRRDCDGWMKVRPTYRFLSEPVAVGDPGDLA